MPNSQQNVRVRRRFPETHLSRLLSPAKREGSNQIRQRPAEVNTVLTIAGVCNGNEIASWTGNQKGLHTDKPKELLNMDKFGVVEVVDRPQSQQVLSTRWVQKQQLDGSYNMRLVARGFEQTVGPVAGFLQECQMLTTLRGLLTTAAFHGNPVTFGDCQSAFHQSPMPSESDPVISRFRHRVGVLTARRKSTT